MKLWKVYTQSVRHLADCSREPGCHSTPGCIGNRTHCPFSYRIWWVLFCQSMNPRFRSRSRLKIRYGLLEDMMRSRFLRGFRRQIAGRLADVGTCEDLMWGVSFFEIVAWMFCNDLLVCMFLVWVGFVESRMQSVKFCVISAATTLPSIPSLYSTLVLR